MHAYGIELSLFPSFRSEILELGHEFELPHHSGRKLTFLHWIKGLFTPIFARIYGDAYLMLYTLFDKGSHFKTILFVPENTTIFLIFLVPFFTAVWTVTGKILKEKDDRSVAHWQFL